MTRRGEPRVLRRALAVAAVGWLPLALLAAVEGKLLGPTLAGSLAGDFALHARSGVAATLLALAGASCFRRLEGVGAGTRQDDKLGRLERAGLVRRAKSAPPLKALRGPAPKAARSVTEALVAERREGR